MILRNFLFLDTATMEDYLATIEGYIVEGAIDQTEVEKKDKSGKAGYKIVEGGIASEKSTETKQKLAVTDAAKFQSLYEILEEQDLVQFLDAFDEEIWNQLHRGELLEIDAAIRFPRPFILTQAIEDFSPLLDIVAAFDIDPKKRGRKINNIMIEDVSALRTLKKRKIDLGIIAVPRKAAQQTADALVKAGVKGILNFAPCYITVHRKVKVITIDIAMDLARLPYYMPVS